jgi:integrase
MYSIKFTTARVRALYTEDKPKDFSDRSFTAGSFGVRAYPSGRKTYFIRYRSKEGKARRFTLGNSEVVSLKDARNKALTILAAVVKGEDPTDTIRLVGKKMSVKELASEFLEKHVNRYCRLVTYHNYKSVINRSIIPAFGAYKISHITPGIINRKLFIWYEQQGEWKSVTIIMSSMFGYALKKGLIDFSPCHGGQLLRYRRDSRRRVLTDEEIIDFWNATERIKRPTLKTYFRCLLLTGLRPSELFHTLRKNVSHGVIRIAPEISKSKHEFILPIPSKVAKMLQHLPKRKDGRLFIPLTDHGRWRSRYFNDVRQSMNIRSHDIRLYDLRRTVATNLERLGFSNDTVAAVLGHSKATRHGGVTYAYTYYVFRDEKKEALTEWCRRVYRLVEGKEAPMPLYASTRLKKRK